MTTEDGVDLCSGDLFYVVPIEDGSSYVPYEVVETPWATVPHNSEYFKFFSTHEEAEKYIDLNKPQYSKLDFLKFLKDNLILHNKFTVNI